MDVLSTWPNEPLASRRAQTGILDLAVGSRWVLAGTADAQTHLFAATDGSRPLQSWPSPGDHPVQCVALSPDETLAVSGNQVGVVQVARIPDGEVIAELKDRRGDPAHTDSVETVAFHPDGRLLATASWDRSIRLWRRDGEKFEELLRLPAPGPVVQAGFSPDGTKLAMLVHNERAVRLWHLDRLFERFKQLGLDW